MITISCENCGKNEYVVEAGVAHCLNCNKTFPTADVANWVHESIVEETKQLIERSCVSSSKACAEILQRAKLALETSNLVEFNCCCDLFLEMQSENSLGWLLKGAAVGWSATVRTPQNFDDAVTYMLKAVALAQADQIEDISCLSQEVIELLIFTLSLQLLEQMQRTPADVDYYKSLENITGKGATLALASLSKRTSMPNADSDVEENTGLDNILNLILTDNEIEAAISIWNSNFEKYTNHEGACDLTRFWSSAFEKYDPEKELDAENTNFAHWLDVCLAACSLLRSCSNVRDLENASFGRLILAANAGVKGSNLYTTMNEIISTCPVDDVGICYDAQISELRSRVDEIKSELQWRSDQRLNELATDE